MKRIGIGICAAGLFAFTGCYDVIFPKIRTEVALEDMELQGAVNSLVRFMNNGDNNVYLVTQNGALHFKDASVNRHGEWYRIPKAPPSVSYDPYSATYSGYYFSKVASGYNNSEHKLELFALGVRFTSKSGDTTPDSVHLFKTEKIGDGWTEVDSWPYPSGAQNSITIFTADVPDIKTNKQKQKAFLRVGSAFYDLSGYESSSKTPFTLDASGNNSITTAITNQYKKYGSDALSHETNAAAYFKKNSTEGYVFYQTTAIGTSKDLKTVYYAKGSVVYANTSPDMPSTSSSHDVGSRIYSIAVNADSIIVGTVTRGLKLLTLSGGSIGDSRSFATNADSAISAPYGVPMLFSLYPDKSETANVLYAGVNFSGTESSSGGNQEDVGMWSYYPERGNWNRE